jgi:cell division septum initiation protein DivIVA
MQTKSDDIIALLRNNLKRIINLYETNKEENRVLREKNEELSRQIEALKNEKLTLQAESNNTDLARAFVVASGTSHDAKIKVNRIVREIDKCIALLNK